VAQVANLRYGLLLRSELYTWPATATQYKRPATPLVPEMFGRAALMLGGTWGS